MRPRKRARASGEKTSRSLSTVVGADIYNAWVLMLRKLVPDGRTHRLAVMVAGMLQYAVEVAATKRDKQDDDRSLAASLLQASDATDPSEVEDLIHDAVVQLFRDAKVRFERINARGDKYSVAEDSYEVFIHWFDMPWE